MPIYEFRCSRGHVFEDFVFTIKPRRAKRVCPRCGCKARKVMSAPNFHFSGSGFYATDYKKSDGRVREDKDDGSIKREDRHSSDTGKDQA